MVFKAVYELVPTSLMKLSSSSMLLTLAFIQFFQCTKLLFSAHAIPSN